MTTGKTEPSVEETAEKVHWYCDTCRGLDLKACSEQLHHNIRALERAVWREARKGGHVKGCVCILDNGIPGQAFSPRDDIACLTWREETR